jgi:hypothetical protein
LDTAWFVEFQCQLDLGITKKGESGIHVLISGFLEFIPAGIAATV